MEVKEFLDRRKHPFYQHGEATQFIAVRGDETVGRILVSDDPLLQPAARRATSAASACSSASTTAATAHALLDAAAGWLRGRGRTAIRGPIDYSINYPCGLLVEGFDTPPRIMMNHNRRYYAGLLESWGLRKAKDLYAWWFVDPLRLGVEVEGPGRAAGPARRRHGPPLPHRRFRGRSGPLPGGLQRRDGRAVGIRPSSPRPSSSTSPSG